MKISEKEPVSGLPIHTDPAGLRQLADKLDARMKQCLEGESVFLWITDKVVIITPPAHHNGK